MKHSLGVTFVICMLLLTSITFTTTGRIPINNTNNVDSDSIEVTVFGLDKNLRFRQSKRVMDLYEYKLYKEELLLSYSISDSYHILKKYDIIDDTITEEQFTGFMNKLSNYLQVIKSVKNLRSNCDIETATTIDGYFLPVNWRLGPSVYNFYIPSIFLTAQTEDNFSYVYIGGEYLDGFDMKVQMYFYLGISTLFPIYCPWIAGFRGFAVYAKAHN